MTTRRKPRDFRTIVVDGHTLWWRFSPGPHSSTLLVVPPGVPGTRCEVQMPSWQDPWFHIDGIDFVAGALQLHSAVSNQPATVTPNFAADAIQYALSQGWQPLQPGPTFHVSFDGTTFVASDSP